MGVINVNFKGSELRADVVAEQLELEIGYLKVLQALNIVLSIANESRKQLNKHEKKELCRRLREICDESIAESISQQLRCMGRADLYLGYE